MRGKEVILKAIKLEKPPRLPVAIMSGGAWTFNKKGYTLEKILDQPELAAEIIVQTNEQVRSDVVWAGSGYNNLPVRALGGKIKFRVKGTMDVQKPLIERAADIDSINLNLLKEDEGIRNVWKIAALLNQAIGDDVLIGASGWGPFTMAAQIYGVERMMRCLYKDPAEVHAVLEFASELCFRYYEGFIKVGVHILSIAEPTSSGDLISRQHFEEFALPYITRFVKRTKDAGVYNLLHICGNITNRLELIPSTGADVLSVDYKVDLGRVKEVVGTKMAFAGNVDPVGILVNGDPDRVAAVSRECIVKAGHNGNYILMPGCDLSTSVPLENVKTMIETGLNWNPRN